MDFTHRLLYFLATNCNLVSYDERKMVASKGDAYFFITSSGMHYKLLVVLEGDVLLDKTNFSVDELISYISSFVGLKEEILLDEIS